MPARYHPLYDGLWDDDCFDARGGLPTAEFEERAFFAFLCSNHRLRPSGIYRATDEQLALDATLPVKRVKRYLVTLEQRGRIVRDGAWIFVRGYLGRQPHHANLVNAALEQVERCSSEAIQAAFAEKYPLLRRPSGNHRRTVAQPSSNVRATYKRKPSSEQSSTEQSNTDQSSRPTLALAISNDGNQDQGNHGHQGIEDEERRIYGRPLSHLERIGRHQRPEPRPA